MKRIKKTATCKSGNKSEKKGAGVNCASNNLERIPEELEIHIDEHCEKFKADADAQRILLSTISDWIDINTYLTITDLMRGLEPKLAVRIAQHIGDFCRGFGRTLTGIDFLDAYLLGIYKHIYDQAKTTGNKLEMPCPF